jgi:hypothetical protein
MSDDNCRTSFVSMTLQRYNRQMDTSTTYVGQYLSRSCRNTSRSVSQIVEDGFRQETRRPWPGYFYLGGLPTGGFQFHGTLFAIVKVSCSLGTNDRRSSSWKLSDCMRRGDKAENATSIGSYLWSGNISEVLQVASVRRERLGDRGTIFLLMFASLRAINVFLRIYSPRLLILSIIIHLGDAREMVAVLHHVYWCETFPEILTRERERGRKREREMREYPEIREIIPGHKSRRCINNRTWSLSLGPSVETFSRSFCFQTWYYDNE